MKKKIVKYIGILLVATLIYSCGDSKEKITEPIVDEVASYQCPMDCEEGKIYEAEGMCPVCEMDLEEM